MSKYIVGITSLKVRYRKRKMKLHLESLVILCVQCVYAFLDDKWVMLSSVWHHMKMVVWEFQSGQRFYSEGSCVPTKKYGVKLGQF